MNFKYTELFLIGYLLFALTGLTQTLNLTAKGDSFNNATLIIYRPHDINSRNNAFKVNIGDISFKIKNNSSSEIKIYKEGELSVNCKKETAAEVKVNIKFGEQYYIRCNLAFGIITARPVLTLVSPEIAENELKGISSIKK